MTDARSKNRRRKTAAVGTIVHADQPTILSLELNESLNAVPSRGPRRFATAWAKAHVFPFAQRYPLAMCLIADKLLMLTVSVTLPRQGRCTRWSPFAGARPTGPAPCRPGNRDARRTVYTGWQRSRDGRGRAHSLRFLPAPRTCSSTNLRYGCDLVIGKRFGRRPSAPAPMPFPAHHLPPLGKPGAELGWAPRGFPFSAASLGISTCGLAWLSRRRRHAGARPAHPRGLNSPARWLVGRPPPSPNLGHSECDHPISRFVWPLSSYFLTCRPATLCTSYFVCGQPALPG